MYVSFHGLLVFQRGAPCPTPARVSEHPTAPPPHPHLVFSTPDGPVGEQCPTHTYRGSSSTAGAWPSRQATQIYFPFLDEQTLTEQPRPQASLEIPCSPEWVLVSGT